LKVSTPQDPYADEKAERVVLGLLLRGSEGHVKALRRLEEDWFTIVECQKVFGLVRDHHARVGRIPGKATLGHLIESSGEASGRAAKYLALLGRFVKDAKGADGDLAYWTERLERKLVARRIMQLVDWGPGGEESVFDLVRKGEPSKAAELMIERCRTVIPVRVECSSRSDFLDSFEESRALVEDMIARPGEYAAISTGIDFVDRKVGGLRPQQLGLVSAETGVGKTSILCALAEAAWQQGMNVFVATIEVPADEIKFKLHARLSGLNSNKFRRAHEGYFEPGDWKVWKDAIKAERRKGGGRRSKLWVADFPNFTSIGEIEAAMADDEARLGVKFDVALVDHLGLLKPDGVKVESAVDGLDWRMQGVCAYQTKFLARGRKMAVWLMVQEKIASAEQRRKGRGGNPLGRIGLSYLIGQAADLGLSIDRPLEDEEDVVDLAISKGRFSGRGRIRLRFDYGTCRLLPYEEPADAD